MKASAPKSLAAGFQLFVKIFVPSLLNHEVDCWMVATAIRTRITSTSRPAASVIIWKVRPQSGRRSDRGRADPAGLAGSALVSVLPRSGPSDPSASKSPPAYEVILTQTDQMGHSS